MSRADASHPLPPRQGASALSGADRCAGAGQCPAKPLLHPSPLQGEGTKPLPPGRDKHGVSQRLRCAGRIRAACLWTALVAASGEVGPAGMGVVSVSDLLSRTRHYSTKLHDSEPIATDIVATVIPEERTAPGNVTFIEKLRDGLLVFSVKLPGVRPGSLV